MTGWSATATFYAQLNAMLRAGLSIARALEAAGDAVGGAYRGKARAWAAACTNGASLASALAGEPPIAMALVRAGEASGHLPELCRRIADIYEQRVRLRNLVIGRLIYPVLLLHAVLFFPTLPGVVLGDRSPLALLIGPGILWGGVGLAWLALHLAGQGSALARLALLWPFSGLTTPLVTTNTCQVLAASLGSGMLPRPALELAADACGNRITASALHQAALGVETHRLPSVTAALAEARLMPLAIQLASAGEVSGTLDESLRKAGIAAEESFATRAAWTAKVATGAVYAGAMLAAAIAIVGMYSNLYAQPLKELEEQENSRSSPRGEEPMLQAYLPCTSPPPASASPASTASPRHRAASPG